LKQPKKEKRKKSQKNYELIITSCISNAKGFQGEKFKIILEDTEEHHTDGQGTKRTQMSQQLRERIDKGDCMKLKSFCTTKEMVSRLKRLPRE
jgi:hypothetical protein